MHTGSGQLIVGIGDHVTHWNSLGWFDPFSSPLYTERLNAYGDAFHLDSVYTPQMVIRGAEQIVGSGQNGLARVIWKEDDVTTQISVHIVSAILIRKSLQIAFSAVRKGNAPDATIFAVIADDLDRSKVLKGESSGRTLAHVAVARPIQMNAKLQPVAEQTVHIELPASFREGQEYDLIPFSQAPGNGRVLGADIKSLYFICRATPLGVGRLTQVFHAV